MRTSSLLLSAAALLVASCSLQVGNGYPPTPQRPTLSSDTTTTYAGSLEVEGGILADPGDDLTVPTTVKYGIDDTTEVFVGATLFRAVDVAGNDDAGFGDMLVGARHRFWEVVDGPSAAAQISAKIPTADDSAGLGSGELDYFAAGIFNASWEDTVSFTGYAEIGLLGDPTGGTDVQQLFALAPSLALNEDLTLFGEFSFLLVDGGADPALLTLGLARALEDGTVADYGLVFGLNDEAPDLAVFIGFTTNLGPVMGERRDSASVQPVRATP